MKPRIYLRDQNDVVLDVFPPKSYKESSLKSYLKANTTVVKFTVLKKENSSELITFGKRISFVYEDEEYWMTCMVVEQDENYLSLICYSIGLEYTNENIGPYTAATPMTFKQYFNIVVFDNSIELGLNEVSDKKLTYQWDGYDTKLGRLFSIAALFDAEIKFVTELNADGSLKKLKLDVYAENSDTNQGIGTDRRGETFYFGKDIKTISKKEDGTDVYTAIEAYGKDGLSIKDIDREVKDADGNVIYKTTKNDRILYAMQAVKQYPANTHVTDKWTVYKAGETEYTTVEGLYGYMLSALKVFSQPEITWEIEGYIEARIGDSVRIYDDGYNPPLILEARVIEQEINWDEPDQSTTTFSNVKVLKDQRSQLTLDKIKDMVEANKVYNGVIQTSNGVQFKNDIGSTTLTAVVKDGVADVTSNMSILWYKDGNMFADTASIEVYADEIDEKSVYSFIATDLGGTIRARAEVTITNVYDGTDGTEGPQGPKGDTGEPGPAGEDGEQGPKGDTGPKGEDGVDGTNGKDGSNGISGDGQLLFNNKFENYETGNFGSMGWSKSIIASVLAAESDFPTYRIMRLRYTAQSFIYSRNIPVVAGNTVLLKFQARTSDLATLTNRLAHIALLDKNAVETTTSATKYVWLRRNGTVLNPGVSNVVVTGALTEVNKWTDFTIQFTVPDDIVNMKLLFFSEPNVDNDFRIPTVVSWKNGEDGNNGIGVTGSSVAYAISLSGILPPTTGWQSTIPDTPAGSFLWTRVIVNYSDGSSTTSYSVGKMGVNGNDGQPTGMVSQSTIPDDPYEGMLWEDTSSTPPVVKIYKNGSWQIWYLHVNNLDVDNLSAISSNMGDLTAGSITGATITGTDIIGGSISSPFDYPEDAQENNWIRGVYTIENGETNLEWERYVKATGTIIERGTDTLRPGQITGENNNLDTGARDEYYSLEAEGLYMTKGNQNLNMSYNKLTMADGLINGSLYADDLSDTGWVDVTSTGVVTSGTVYLRRFMRRLILRLDNVVLNGTGTLCVVPAHMNLMSMSAMYRVQQWSANTGAAEFPIIQTNATSGAVAKASSSTQPIRGFIELF